MKTPQEWNYELRLEVPTLEAFKLIGQVARAHLEHNVTLDDMVSTTTLVEALYPLAYAKQSEAGMAARGRILKALTARALGRYDLKDCMIRGVLQPLGIAKKMGRPCLWHAPRKPLLCPHCGQEWPKQKEA
jgi:hypothetical protein